MKKIFIILAGALMLASCGSKGPKAELKLNLETGKTYAMTTTSDSKTAYEVMGQKVDMTMTMGATFSFLVKSKAETNYVTDLTYEDMSVKIDMSAAGQNMSVNSRDTTNAQGAMMGKMFSKLLHQPITLTMTDKGSVTNAEGFDKMLESISNSVPAENVEQIKKLLSQSFNEKAICGNIELVTAIYPDKPVAVGDTWTVKIENSVNGMAAMIESKYEYQGESGDCYLIKGTSDISTDKSQTIKTNGMDVECEIKGTMTSDLKILKATGWISTGDVIQKLTLKMKIMGMEVPMNMDINTHYEGK